MASYTGIRNILKQFYTRLIKKISATYAPQSSLLKRKFFSSPSGNTVYVSIIYSDDTYGNIEFESGYGCKCHIGIDGATVIGSGYKYGISGWYKSSDSKTYWLQIIGYRRYSIAVLGHSADSSTVTISDPTTTAPDGVTFSTTFNVIANTANVSDVQTKLNNELVSTASISTYANKTAYSVGTFVWYDNKLYKCITAVASTNTSWPSSSFALQSIPILSGDILVNRLNTRANSYNEIYGGGGINMNNSDIVGANAIVFGDASDNASEGIRFYRSATNQSSLWGDSSGYLKWAPSNTVVAPTSSAAGSFTAGTSYLVGLMAQDGSGFPTLLNSAGTGTWIRAAGSSYGFIPYQAAAAGSGIGGIGTASWYFGNSYIDHHHGADATLTTSVTIGSCKQSYDSTYKCLNFTFS